MPFSYSMIMLQCKAQFWSYAISQYVVCSGGCDISIMCFFVVKLKFKDIACEKMHMLSILARYGFRWHSDKPYRTRLRLVRYGLSECHLNLYRTRMDTICISYWELQTWDWSGSSLLWDPACWLGDVILTQGLRLPHDCWLYGYLNPSTPPIFVWHFLSGEVDDHL